MARERPLVKKGPKKVLKKVLWIGFIWPEPSSSAAGVRTMQLIRALREAGSEVHFSSPCQPNEYRQHLEAAGIPTAHYAPNDSRFDSYIRKLAPDAVFFDRFMIEEQFAWRVREQCPGAARILDTIDLHSLRRARQNALEENPPSTRVQAAGEAPAQTTDDAIRELAAIYRSDLTLVVSDFEADLLTRHYGAPKELIELCRFFGPSPQPTPPFNQRKDFVTIGNFRHAPNLDSYRLLRESYWPAIRAKLTALDASAELHIYGAYPCKEMMDLDDPKTGFRARGWAKDAHDTLAQYRVSLAPLRFGAGIKGKVSESWGAGTPCIASSIAAEGMHESLPFGGEIADDLERFSDAAVRLYLDATAWSEAHERGTEILAALFDQGKNSKRFLESLHSLTEDLPARRGRNFVGAMLWHHQHRSTEYFSRWIEAKNIKR